MNRARPALHRPARARPIRLPADARGLIVAERYDYPAGEVLDDHTHDAAQLLYATSGVMSVTTAAGIFVVPPLRAVWIPANVVHSVHLLTDVSMRTLLVHAAVARQLLDTVQVVSISPFMRELILQAFQVPAHRRLAGRREWIVRLILDELTVIPSVPLHLPQPRDRRLRRIADALIADPADERTLADWSRTVGASRRTLMRGFKRETGLGFEKWRQQARLQAALAGLARGLSVTTVALDVGYATPGAFATMFRRALGRAPSRYFKD